MNKMKFFTIFSLLLFIFIGYRTYAQYNDIQNTEKMILLNESESLAGFVDAFRKTYQDVFVVNHIKIDDKTLNFLPVKTISDISKRFSKNVNGDVIIRTVSDRPRNMDNMANSFELEQIQYFKDNPRVNNNFIHKEHSYFYTKPMYIEPLCMKCHGKREDAIPSVRDKYSRAYDYKLGELRGLLNIEVKKRDVFKMLYADFIENLLETFILYVFLISIIYFLLYKMKGKEEEYTRELEKELDNKTKEIQKQKDVLYIQAHHDALTGLPNRVLFLDRLEHAIESAQRNQMNIAIFFIDIDHFKEINDSLGHYIGDKVLIEITKRFKSQMRSTDTLARLGGDEFTVVFENLKQIEDAYSLAKKIQYSLVEPMYIDEHIFYITCSIGISTYPQDCIKSENLLKFSDTAMYQAKEEGRNKIQFYTSKMTDDAQEKLTIQTNLRQALEKNELVVYYQPQMNVKNNKCIGLEALIRWNHPTKGLLFPKDFINIAALSGLIIQIDTWVMQTAMEEFSNWIKKGFKPGILSLNLSMRQLQSNNFIHLLEENLKKYDFEPKFLVLEITESQVMLKPEESILKLGQISNMGISISIDDFGTGYSSLAYLKRLPVDELKIDKSFIEGLPHDKDNIEIIKAIIALGKSLALNIVAEGVETEEERDALFEYGCEYVQGYLYYQALPVKEVEDQILKK